MLIVGILNILGGVGVLFRGVQILMISPEERQQAERQLQQDPKQREKLKELEKQGFSLDKALNLGAGVILGWGGLALICGLVTLLGGLQMRSLHSYGLAVTASILALIPCLSPTACCGVGEGIGIWALVVLLSSDVKSAFR